MSGRERFVLDYDDRSDGGPRLVGPFDSRSEAFAHAQQIVSEAVEQHGTFSSEFTVSPLHAPEVSS